MGSGVSSMPMLHRCRMVESKVSKQTSRLVAESGKSCMLSLSMPAQGVESPAGAD